MRNLLMCVLTLALVAQAVGALKCYHCPTGGRCFSTQTCRKDLDQCVTVFYPTLAKYTKRCASQYECDVMRVMGGSVLKAVCCGTNLCNR
ncbi:CD59A glycoprotein-like [Chelonia mydas]|uniref:CD59A glycoprotein-like n=1 Tax=Chelonia mydas TaxID=8469 RepID=UPI0018A1E039|nr:CD59A glycoprotein-like [Chelonia mydas]